MKMRTMLVVMLGLGLATTGCKKKKAEETGGTGTMAGSAGSAGSDTAMGSAGGAMGSAGSAAEPAKEATKHGADLVAKYMECLGQLNAGKLDEFKANCLATEYKGHAADGPEIASADALLEQFKANRVAFPDLKLEPQLVLVNGRNVFGVHLMTGTHQGPMKTPMGEVPATTKKVGMLFFHRLAINDENRATEEWAYMDPGTMMGQLGLVPKEVKMRAAMDKGMEGAPVIVVAADDAKEQANVELVKKAGAAFAGKKPAEYMAFYADGAVESDQAGEKDAVGKKDIEAGAKMFLGAFPDLKMEQQGQFAAGDFVVELGTFAGTHTGPLGKLKPTKKPVHGQYAEIIHIKDGKIAKIWRFRNGMAMAAQLGLMGDAPKGDAPKGDAPKGDAPKTDAPKADPKMEKKGG